jgi:signal transduction histidine kinase
MLSRLGTINRAAQRIMTGDLTHRIQTSGSRDEFDQLSEQLNLMLEEIRRLMVGMRTVTDNIAHDLRSPLTRMKGRLEMVLRDSPDPAAQRGAIERTIADADQLLATFTALLSIADAESGSARASMTQLDLGALATDIAELYGPAAEERGIAMHCAPASGMIVGSRQLLFQAIANLVDNAIKHTPDGGEIALELRAEPTAVSLVVRDTGPGSPEQARDRVMEPFVRLDTSRSTPGSGLGLALVAAIARLHNARVSLSDNGPGLVVTLAFPVPA